MICDGKVIPAKYEQKCGKPLPAEPIIPNRIIYDNKGKQVMLFDINNNFYWLRPNGNGGYYCSLIPFNKKDNVAV